MVKRYSGGGLSEGTAPLYLMALLHPGLLRVPGAPEEKKLRARHQVLHLETPKCRVHLHRTIAVIIILTMRTITDTSPHPHRR